jgi:hypothetical protein
MKIDNHHNYKFFLQLYEIQWNGLKYVRIGDINEAKKFNGLEQNLSKGRSISYLLSSNW